MMRLALVGAVVVLTLLAAASIVRKATVVIRCEKAGGIAFIQADGSYRCLRKDCSRPNPCVDI